MGSVRPWGYPGRGLLTTPSRGYPQIQPPPKIPASARSHLAHQITSNPGLWLGFAHHLLIWGVATLPGRIFTPPTPVSGGRRPDTAGPPRAPPVQARPRSGAAPWRHGPGRSSLLLGLFTVFSLLLLLFLSHGPAKPPGELLSVHAGGCRRWQRLLEQEGLRARRCRTPCL